MPGSPLEATTCHRGHVHSVLPCHTGSSKKGACELKGGCPPLLGISIFNHVPGGSTEAESKNGNSPAEKLRGRWLVMQGTMENLYAALI